MQIIKKNLKIKTMIDALVM